MLPRIRWKLIALALVIAFCGAALWAGRRVTRGVVYSASRSLRLDLHQPLTPGPHPLVIAIHGGFWKYGDRKQLAPYCIWLVRRGYAVACIDYSPAFPASLEDVEEAVRFLKRSADDYGLDKQRIALLGTSSGGHLANLAALGPEKVQAVVDLYGPTDLTTRHMAEDTLVKEVFGSRLKEASPLHRPIQKTPPFLIVHGDRDQVVPLQQSQEWQRRLLERGNQASLLVVHNAGHDLAPVDGQPEPSLFQVAGRIADFLDQNLSQGVK